MEAWKKLLLGGTAIVGAGLLSVPAEAQQSGGTLTNQQSQRADAATALTGPAGGRTTCSTSQDSVANLTVTLTPNGSNYIYVLGVYIDGQANATGATSTTVWSSTNLNTSTVVGPAWLTSFTATAAANPSSTVHVSDMYPTGLKSTIPGTAVTIVPQATSASAFLCPRVAWYQGS